MREEIIIMSYNVWKMYLYQYLHDFEGLKIPPIEYMEGVR